MKTKIHFALFSILLAITEIACAQNGKPYAATGGIRVEASDSRNNVPIPCRSVPDKKWETGGMFEGQLPEKEILNDRTEFTKKFNKGNGIVDVIFGGPFHYLDAYQLWQDINLDIQTHSDPIFKYINEANRFISRFAENPSNGVELKYKSETIAFGLNSKIKAGTWAPQPSSSLPDAIQHGNIITYQDVYQDVNLEYELSHERVQHRLIFQRSGIFSGLTNQDFLEVSEEIQLPDGTVLKDELGTISSSRKTSGLLSVTKNGEIIFSIIPSRAWDASFNGDIYEDNSDIQGFIKIETFITVLTTRKYILTSKLPTEWLLAQNRVFPITFDPDYYLGNQSSPSATHRYPFNTCRAQRVGQTLFLNSYIGMTGSISKIAFYRGPINSAINNSNVVIKMQDVSWTEMTTCTHTSSGFTQVYGPGTQSFASVSTGWRDISISSFQHNNNNNLLIETRFNNSNNTPANTPNCTCSNTSLGGYWGHWNAPYYGHRWGYSNNINPPPTTCPGTPNDCPVEEQNTGYGNIIPAVRLTFASTCSYTLSSSSYTFPSNSTGSNNVTLTTQSGCAWTATATSTGGWLSVSPTSGSSSQLLAFSANSQNNGTSSRQGTITIKDASNSTVATFTVTQPGVSQPTISHLTITNVIENHPGIDRLYPIYTGSPTNTSNPTKICADGSTATYFKIRVSSDQSKFSFRIRESGQIVVNAQNSNNAAQYGKLSAPDIFSNGVDVEVAYTHPTYMNANGTFKICTLEVLYDNVQVGGIEFPLHIYRAPIVFVHGFTGDKGTFEKLENELFQTQLYPKSLLHRLDFRKKSVYSFSVNRNVVPTGIDDIIKSARSANYSAGNVILIGHSMGGILSRLYLQNPNYRKDIAKLITANTPHYGTQFANWGLRWNNVLLLQEIMQIMMPVSIPIANLGAIKDMQVDSKAIGQDLNVSQINKVPSATLSTNAFGVNSFKAKTVKFIMGDNFISSIYFSEVNDLIVPLPSQQGGISTNLTIPNEWHVGSVDNDLIIDQIKTLIDLSPSNNIFVQTGFPLNTLQPPPAMKSPNTEYLASRSGSNDSIKIISPIASSFAPNSNVPVKIFYEGDITRMALIAYGNAINPIIIDTANVNQINFEIPSTAIGDIRLLLLGGDGTKWSKIDTGHITVNSLLIPDSIRTDPQSINLPWGLHQSVSVLGYFNGSTTPVNIIAAPGLTLQYDTSYLSYDGNGSFQGLKTGNTNVTYTYKGKTASTQFTVYNNPYALTASFDYSTDKTCTGVPISFTAQSLGIPTAYQWTFPGGSPTSGSGSPNQTVIYNSVGKYPVKIRTTFVNGVDSLLINELIDVSLPPSVSIDTASNTSSVTLKADAGFVSYLWSTGATTPSINTDTAGYYTVKITDDRGCSATASMTVSPSSVPQCVLHVEQPLGIIPHSGTNYGSIEVWAARGVNCKWDISGVKNWAHINEPTSLPYTGSTFIKFSVDPNPDDTIRSCTLYIDLLNGNSYKYTITQEASPNDDGICNTSLPTPPITADGCMLSTDYYENASYQWFFNGNIIPGRFSRNFYAMQGTGTYQVRVSSSSDIDCEATSDTLNMNCLSLTGLEELNNRKLSIIPNPSNGNFTVRFESNLHQSIEIRIFDLTGKFIKEERLVKEADVYTKEINLGNVAKGVYLMQLKAGDEIFNRRVVVQ